MVRAVSSFACCCIASMMLCMPAPFACGKELCKTVCILCSVCCSDKFGMSSFSCDMTLKADKISFADKFDGGVGVGTVLLCKVGSSPAV